MAQPSPLQSGCDQLVCPGSAAVPTPGASETRSKSVEDEVIANVRAGEILNREIEWRRWFDSIVGKIQLGAGKSPL